MFTTPKVILLVVSTTSGPDPLKYVLFGLTGDTSVGYFRSVMTLESTETYFQSDVATYRYSCSIVSIKCATSLAVPNLKNTSLYPLVGARNILFVVSGALLAEPDFFQGLFPFFTILNMLNFIGIMLREHHPSSSALLVG